jgi:bifunctional DNase/RNase
MNALLPFAAAVTLAGALAAAAPDGGEEQVELEVAGVFPLDDDHAGVLVLREKGAETLLPIVIGRSEVDGIGKRLRGEVSSRPRTQDLLAHAIEALGGHVVRVEIHDASDALYRARVFVAQGAQRIELDARPSDSIALAVGAKAPIFAPRGLLAGSGLTAEDLDRLRRPAEPPPGRLGEPAAEQHM